MIIPGTKYYKGKKTVFQYRGWVEGGCHDPLLDRVAWERPAEKLRFEQNLFNVKKQAIGTGMDKERSRKYKDPQFDNFKEQRRPVI